MLVHSMLCAARVTAEADCDCHVRDVIQRRGTTGDTGWTRDDTPWQSDATGTYTHVPSSRPADREWVAKQFTEPRPLLPDLDSLVARILDNQKAMLEMHAANLRSVEKLLTILNLIAPEEPSHEQ